MWSFVCFAVCVLDVLLFGPAELWFPHGSKATRTARACLYKSRTCTHTCTLTDTNMHTRTADVPYHGCNSVTKLCKRLNEYFIEYEHRKRMSRIFCRFQLQMLNIKDFVPHMSVDTQIGVLVRALIMQIFLTFSNPSNTLLAMTQCHCLTLRC